MSRVVEVSACLALATAVHLALWASSHDGAPGSAGMGGSDSLTVSAVSPALADLVAAWDRPPPAPETPMLSTPQAPTAMTAPAALPQIAAPRSTPSSPAAPSAPVLNAALAPALPSIDTQTPPAPPKTRPRSRPETLARTPPAPKPAAAAKPESESRASQSAAGQGQTTAAGTTATRADPTLSPARTATLMAQWGGGVRSSIERRKRYPGDTRARGTVHLSIQMRTDGALTSVSVARSSGDAALDRAAITAVQSARLPAAPRALPPGTHAFSLPMSFTP
ncbi:TonB family protein [Roseovarius sp. LXJ103]|uniref:energy transducer TonB family protein n=1 Tax=Roseovarius carneus TaxID=2853164 RepID=UPI000D612D3A|nr:energy transducer TonB [Roseovarius carneus]MBZ8118600.1 TonB family protein [Roseovarius carneus]PWE35712.1 hypothetical protein DD563_06915 [Pelagicola sp. LXJ1103]